MKIAIGSHLLSLHIALHIYRHTGQYVPGNRLNVVVAYTGIVIVQQCVSNFMGKVGKRTLLAKCGAALQQQIR